MRVYPLIFIIISLMIVACKKETANSTAISPTGSPTAQQIYTSPAGETPTSIQPTPSVTPNPTQTEPVSLFANELIPIPAKPSHPATVYKLREWTEAAWLASIEEAKIFVDPLIENWSRNPNYTPGDLMTPLIMMEKEALLRYPNMDSYNELAWDLAYRESLNFGRPYTVDRLTSLLVLSLNSGEITLDSINSNLDSKGFSVVARFDSDNLFGNTQAGTVLQIESPIPSFSVESLSLIAIGKSEGGYFHVIPVDQFWYWNYHRGDTVSVTDTNYNQMAEVMVDTYSWSSGIPGGCSHTLALYEWQGPLPDGQFENLAANISDISMSGESGSCERPWEFEEDDVTGIPTIKTVSRYTLPGSTYIPGGADNCPRYELWTIYQWNGQIFEWANNGLNSLESEGSPICTIGWAYLAGGLNDEAISLLETALSSWPIELNDIWGPASEDFFRFELGTWYALRGETELTINTLQSVRDNPTNPDFGKASELAAIFLANYDSHDVNTACNEVLEHLNEVAPTSECCGLNTETILETWGFANPLWSYRYYMSEVCTLEPNTANVEPSETTFSQSQRQEQAVAQIERTLFIAGDYAQARAALLDLLDTDLIGPENGAEVRTYLRYLLALTYELSGDESNAVDLYWQLWNEFPESPYTPLIRLKLELL